MLSAYRRMSKAGPYSYIAENMVKQRLEGYVAASMSTNPGIRIQQTFPNRFQAVEAVAQVCPDALSIDVRDIWLDTTLPAGPYLVQFERQESLVRVAISNGGQFDAADGVRAAGLLHGWELKHG